MSSVAILGASGYSGQETLDRVLRHPLLEVVALGSDSLSGQPASALDLPLNGSPPPVPPHGNGRAAVLEPPAGAVVVDLSGAHRLQDSALYPAWYGFEHPRPDTLAAWSYGLPELFPADGELIANPGCYATAALPALAPLAGAIEPAGVVIDAKSGVSGAGRELKQSSHAGFVLENVAPYRVGSHQTT